jgi:hypothetical protein
MGNNISKYEDCPKKKQRKILTEVNELNNIICHICNITEMFGNTRYEHYVTNWNVAEDAEETKRREDRRELANIRKDFNQRQTSGAFINEYQKKPIFYFGQKLCFGSSLEPTVNHHKTILELTRQEEEKRQRNFLQHKSHYIEHKYYPQNTGFSLLNFPLNAPSYVDDIIKQDGDIDVKELQCAAVLQNVMLLFESKKQQYLLLNE